MKKEKIIISSCLLGHNCRWHGRKVSVSSFVKKYIKQKEKEGIEIECIMVCPELLGGLTVPRKPVKRLKDRVWETCEDKKLRAKVTGKELTKEFKEGALKVLEIAKEENIKKAILCQWSPSCDIKGITGKLLNENEIEIINTF
ncbi:MAG: DUF523 domain-containing protein [Thermotogota bacterium]|nr:DUF523 domain-containing protein [Thermotogota bacterium]